jgi:uncharacterized protein (TIGR03067 family)
MKTKLNTPHVPFAFAKNIPSLIFIGMFVAILAGCNSLFPNPDYEKMEGVWETKLSDNEIAVVIVENDSLLILDTLVDNPRSEVFNKKYKFILDSSKNPKHIKLLKFGADKEDWRGIFELSDKRMKVAFANNKDAPIPSTFKESDTWLFEWKGESAKFAPKDSNYLKGVKTWNYWTGLNHFIQSNATENPFANVETPEQAISACEKTIEVLNTLRSRINDLPVSDVDTEVTSYVSEYLDNLNLVGSMLGDMVQVLKDAQQLAAVGNSDEALGMSIIELFLGKPGATIEALDAEAQQLKNRMLTVQNQAKQVGAESDRLGTKQLQLRRSLSGKYDREFPQFKI